MLAKRWAYTMEAIAVAANRNPDLVRRDSRCGKFNPGVLVSVAEYVAAHRLDQAAARYVVGKSEGE